MAWYLKGKPKKWAHHYGTALRSASSYLDQPRRPPVPAAHIRWSGNGRTSMALSICYWLPGKQWCGSPSIPQSPAGKWCLMGDSQDHKHKAITQNDPAVNLETPLESNLEDGCNSWTVPSEWPTGPAWPTSHVSPTVGTALGASPPAPAHTDQGLGREGEKTTPCLKGLGLDPDCQQLRVVLAAPGLFSPYHSRLQPGREHWARGQDVNWALTLPLKPALCSAGGAKHVMTPLNSHQSAAGIVSPQSLWAPSSAGASASLLRKSLLEWRIQWASTNTELDWEMNHSQSLQNTSEVTDAMYFHKWNNNSWLHFSWVLALRQHVLIDVNNYKGCWSSRPTPNSLLFYLITDL